jgi:hypothetical protein
MFAGIAVVESLSQKKTEPLQNHHSIQMPQFAWILVQGYSLGYIWSLHSLSAT